MHNVALIKYPVNDKALYMCRQILRRATKPPWAWIYPSLSSWALKLQQTDEDTEVWFKLKKAGGVADDDDDDVLPDVSSIISLCCLLLLFFLLSVLLHLFLLFILPSDTAAEISRAHQLIYSTERRFVQCSEGFLLIHPLNGEICEAKPILKLAYRNLGFHGYVTRWPLFRVDPHTSTRPDCDHTEVSCSNRLHHSWGYTYLCAHTHEQVNTGVLVQDKFVTKSKKNKTTKVNYGGITTFYLKEI